MRDGLPSSLLPRALSDRLEDRRRVAHNEKAAGQSQSGPALGFCLDVDVERKTQMQTRGAVWQLRPDAPIAPARLVSSSLGRPLQQLQHPCATLLPSGVVQVLIRQILVLVQRCSYFTLHKIQEHKVPQLATPHQSQLSSSAALVAGGPGPGPATHT